MGNESSSVSSTKDGLTDEIFGLKKRRYAPKNNKKRVLLEQNQRTSSVDSDTGSSFIGCGTAAKAVLRKTSAQKSHKTSVAEAVTSSSPPDPQNPASQLLRVPDFDTPYIDPNSRKISCQEMTTLLDPDANGAGGRRRSRSLCTQQMQKDCAAIQNSQTSSGSSTSRRSSNGTLPTLARIRIQHCFKRAKPTIGSLILKRACALRPEIKPFLGSLPQDRVEELGSNLYNFVTECVNNVDSADTITEISKDFGRIHVQLCNYGFRPDFFSIIADATIAECVRLDGGAHKRCETLLAWSQLMQSMFSSVRDGYYAEIRQQRRSSLPQHRLLSKQGSHNVSIDIES
ncbi:unnamed protein product [Bursaphelenchus xylophilus]|uniref:(pine wood nematode) hypothetical protein n=1 Tax=Bursaphelenchus xylophilus TaxID=6326 RepID=A0A1I7STI8_BURXY|nr:unnamed protein product [Bursaphelenchus xylophilus]CAG9108364.1 unnamed protein product [Bursaphelenchus xylophilus]